MNKPNEASYDDGLRTIESQTDILMSDLSTKDLVPAQEYVMILPSKVFEERSGVYRAYPTCENHWTANSVLQWLESLAKASEAFDNNSLVVNGVSLSEPSYSPIVASYSKEASFSSMDDAELLIDRKMSNMELLDPAGRQKIRRIMNMAEHVDNHCCSQRVGAAQTQFQYIFDRIMEQSTKFGFESRYLLDTLYHNTFAKLQAIVNLECEDIKPKKELKLCIDPTVSPKKDFAEIMTAWLIENWINPYPDEDGLVDLAAMTETTSSVVGNWLINARTRKWRPAIVKASKCLHRPTHMLLEDSINIFLGVPLRDLDEQAVLSQPASASTSLHNAGGTDLYFPPNKRFRRI